MRGTSMLVACVMLTTRAPAFAPHAAAQGGTLTQTILVEVATDRTENLTWQVVGVGASPEGVYLPNGSRALSVTYHGARVPFTTTNDAEGNVYVRPNLSVTRFVVHATRDAPPGDAQPLYASSVPVSAYPLVVNEIHVQARVPAGNAIFWLSTGTIADNGMSASGSLSRAGWWTFAYRAPLEPSAGLIEIDEGIYRLVGPRASEDVMRRVARVASEAAVPALAQAGVVARPPYWVRYAPAQVFGWEEGYYGNDGIIALRKSLLANDSSVGFPWAAAEALVHETFHAATLPHGPNAMSPDLSWWIEGSARHAERFVGGDDGWRACDGPWCWTFQSQIHARDLEALYAGSWRFDPRWDPAASADGRAEIYQYSGFLVASFVARYGDAAYHAAWTEIRGASEDPSCSCDEAWLRNLLLRLSGGRLSLEELYHPYRELASDDHAAFADAIAPLVANAPREGKPIPQRLNMTTTPLTPITPNPPGARGWSPALRFATDAPAHRVAWATVVTLEIADLEINRTASRPEGPPAARLRWTLDGEPVTPRAHLDGPRLVATFDRVKGGVHAVAVEAIPVAGVDFDPPIRAEASFLLSDSYELTIADPWGIDITTPTTLVVSLRDAIDGTPHARRPILLDTDGIPIHVALTDAEGLARFPLAGAALGPLRLALTVEDDPTAQGARIERTFRNVAPVPAEALAPGAVYEPPEDARVPGPGAAIAVVAAIAAAGVARRARHE